MAQISLRVDDDLKASVEQLCKDFGISMSALVNIYFKKLDKERKIPFEIDADPFYSAENMALLERRAADMKAGKNIVERDIIEVE